MQIDGEPVLLQASEINIEKKNQALMIAADDDDISSCVNTCS